MSFRFEDIIKFEKITWEELPDFGLYSEQLISFMEDKLKSLYLEDEKIITPSMINNYVKLNMMPKPKNKKYYREHIAHLLVISILKSILPIKDINKGIGLQVEIMGIENSYNEFMDILEKTMNNILKSFNEKDLNFVYKGFSGSFENISLTFVIQAFCFQVLTKVILNMKGLYHLKGEK